MTDDINIYYKDFQNWHILKSDLDNIEDPPTFKEREVWWCSVGVNIGSEVDGKNKLFNRPVLVIRKFNRFSFWGVPLSSKMKNNPHYYHFSLNNKPQAALITQLRLYDSRRITHHMAKVPPLQFKKIQQEIIGKLLKT